MGRRCLLLFSVLLMLLTGCDGAAAKKPAAPTVAARQGYVYALDATAFDVYQVPGVAGVTGKAPFFQLPIQTSLTPRLVPRIGGGVYLAIDGTLSAWSQGKRLWTSTLSDGVQAITATAQDVYVVTSQQVIAVDADTGKLVWQETYTSGGIFASQVFAVFLSPLVIVAQGEYVQAFDAATGLTRWNILLPTAGDGEVITAMNGAHATIVLCTGTSLVALNTLTGQTRWQQDDQALLSAVSADGTTLYLPFQETPRILGENGSQSHMQTGVEAVNLLSGVVQWRDVFALKPTEMGSLTGQYLSWISTDGTITTWRLSDGRQLWQTTRCARPVALAVDATGQSVVVLNSQGEVDALRLLDGHSQWMHLGSGEGLTSGNVQIDTHAVYVLDVNTLEALTRTGGQVAWSLTLDPTSQWITEPVS